MPISSFIDIFYTNKQRQTLIGAKKITKQKNREIDKPKYKSRTKNNPKGTIERKPKKNCAKNT